MKTISALLLLLFATVSPEIRYFSIQRLVEHTPGNQTQACMALGPEIFAHAAANLSDLRLYHDSVETPYAIRVSPAVQTAKESIAPINLGKRGANISFDAAMPQASYGDIELDVSGENFLATVTVSGSQNQTDAGRTNIGSFTIFDLTHQKLGRSTILHLPASDFRYLHFDIAGGLAPESIQSLTVEKNPLSEPEYETVAESTRVTERDHSSVLEFNVPALVPVDYATFVLGPEPQSLSRNVTITVTSREETAIVTPAGNSPEVMKNEDTSAPIIATGSLLRVHRVQNGRRIDAEQLGMNTPTAVLDKPAKWTVSVDNGDDAPLQIKAVRLQMLRRTLCFDAGGAGRYTLFYGDSALAVPQYDYASLFTPQANGAQASLGPEQHNPAYQPRPDQRPLSERYPAVLWGALLIVVASLATIAFRSARRTGKEDAS